MKRFLYDLGDGSYDHSKANGSQERLANLMCGEVSKDESGQSSLSTVYFAKMPNGGSLIRSQPMFALARFQGNTLLVTPQDLVPKERLSEVASVASR